MKLLAVILLCGLAAASATSGTSSEYGLIEDIQSFLANVAEKVRQHLQQALDKLKEKIQEHKYIFEALKDQIALIQGKIRELVKNAKDNLIAKAREVREHLQNLFKQYVEIFTQGEKEKFTYALYEGEDASFIDRLAQRIKTSLESLLATAIEKVEKYTEIAGDVKDRIVAIKDKLTEIPKAGAAKLLEIARAVKDQIKNLLKDVIEKVTNKEEAEENLYALYEVEEGGFLERLSERIKAQLERFLNRIVELVEKYTDIYDNIKERVRAIKEKLQEIPKAGFSKFLELAQKLKEQIKDLLKETVDKIANKHEKEVVGYSLYDTEGGLLDRIAERIRTTFESALEKIQERIEKYGDIAQQFKEKVLAIKDKLKELASASGQKLIEVATKIRTQIRELFKDVLNKIANKEVAEYSFLDRGEETLIGSVARVLREKLQVLLNTIKSRLEQHKEVFEAFKEKMEEIQEQINQLSKAAITRVISIAGTIRVKITELIKAITEKVGLTIALPYADQVRKPGDASRRRLQTHLDELKKRVAKYPEVQAQFQEKLDLVQQKVDAVADLSGLELALTSSRVLKEIGSVRAEILDIIGTRRP